MKQNQTFFGRVKEGIFDMCYIWLKEVRNVVKDEGMLIFFILVPLIYPILYSWIYNNEVAREVPVAVVDMSHSKESRTYIRNYDASPNVSVSYRCNSIEEADNLIGHQKCYGIVYIPSDFSTSLNRMEQTTVTIYCNMSFLLYYKAIYQTAAMVSNEMNSKIQVSLSGNSTDRQDEILTQPLAYEEVALFNETGGYGNFIIPGVLMLVLQQTLLLGIGLSAGTARENNRFRNLVPISKHYNGIFRIVLGKSACYSMVYAVIAAFEVLVVPRLFNFVHIGSPSAVFGIMVPYILACVFFGMFFSCIIRHRENVMLLIVFTSVPFLFLSGVSWPQNNIPGAWQGIACLIPSTFGVRAYVRINSMGATLADVNQEYVALWIQVLAYFFLTCLTYRHQINLTRRHELARREEIKGKVKMEEG